MVAVPEVSVIVEQYETLCGAKMTMKRLSTMLKHAEKKFIDRVHMLYSVMKEMGNAFIMLNPLLLTPKV